MKIRLLAALLFLAPAAWGAELIDRVRLPRDARGVKVATLTPILYAHLPILPQIQYTPPGGAGITSGTTTITGGSDGDILYNNGGVVSGFQGYNDSGAGNATFLVRKTPGASEYALEVSNGTVAQGIACFFDNTTCAVAVEDGGNIDIVNGSTTNAAIHFDPADPDYGIYFNSFYSTVGILKNGLISAVFPADPGVLVRSDGGYQWAANTTPTGSYDTQIARKAAGVAAVQGASAAAGWLQQTAGEVALNADYTNATASMTSTALSVTVKSGRTYSFSAALMFANSTAADGFLFDFNGGTATVTNFRVGCSASNAAGAALAFTNAVSVALDTDIDVTLALTTQAKMSCEGTFVPSADGTFIIRASEKVDGGGTLTIFRGSWLNVRDANPL